MEGFSVLYLRLLAFGFNTSIKLISKPPPPRELRVRIYMTESKQDLTVYMMVLGHDLYILQRDDSHEHYLE